MEIRIEFDDDRLFGADDPVAHDVDAEASHDCYARLVLDKVANRYPEATIEVAYVATVMSKAVSLSGPEFDTETGLELEEEMRAAILELVGLVWRNSLWLVWLD